MLLHQITTRIDLNSDIDSLALISQGAANEHRTNNLFATNRLSATRSISAMRATIQRQPQNQNILLSRPVSGHGVRPTDRQGITARHRSLLTNVWTKTVSRRLSLQTNLTQHSGQRQSNPTVADLRRFRPIAHRHRHRTLLRHRSWPRPGQHNLRSGFNHHCPVHVAVSMGNFSSSQVGRQDAHTTEPQRLDTRVYKHYRGLGARCEHSRRSVNPIVGDLFVRSGIPGFRSTFHNASSWCILRDTSSSQHSLSAYLLAPDRQSNGAGVRPDYPDEELPRSQKVSRSTSPSSIQRPRDGQSPGVFDQYVSTASHDDRDAISQPMAGGVILQMDQTTPANQTIFWYEFQCRQNANLDCGECLRPGCNCQKAIGSRAEPLHIATDSKPQSVRENAYFTGLFATRIQNGNW